MSDKDKFECENCGGYLAYIGQGSKRKCEGCGHIQYTTTLPEAQSDTTKEQWARTAAIQQKKISALKGLLKESAPVICSYLCPSTWKTGEKQPHSDLCVRLQSMLAEEDPHA